MRGQYSAVRSAHVPTHRSADTTVTPTFRHGLALGASGFRVLTGLDSIPSVPVAELRATHRDVRHALCSVVAQGVSPGNMRIHAKKIVRGVAFQGIPAISRTA